MKFRPLSLFLPVAVLAGVLAIPCASHASTFSWSTGVTTAWSSSSGWTLTSGAIGSGFPVAGDTAIFGDSVGNATISGAQAALNLNALSTINTDIIGLNGTLNVGTFTRNGANAMTFRGSGASTLSLSFDNIVQTSGITYFGQNSSTQGLTAFSSTGTTSVNGGLVGFHILNSGTAFLNAVNMNSGTLSVRQTSTTGTNTVSVTALTGTAGTITTASVAGSRGILMASSGSLGGTASIATGGSAVMELLKVGTGTLTLNGASNTVNQVTVKDGVLSYVTGGNADIFGASAAITIDGGTLDIKDRADAIGSLTLVSGTYAGTGGRLNASGGYNVQSGYVTGLMGAGGALTKTTSGTVTLASTTGNIYTGGSFLNGGVLQISQDAHLGNVSGTVAFNGGALQTTTTFSTARLTTLLAGGGEYIVDPATILTHTGTIQGGGNLTKSGLGTLVLGSDNTFTGTTIISSGTLQLGNGSTTGSVTGAIVDNASLVFNRSGTYNVGNTISGSGNVQVAGSGTASFTASNTFSGTVGALSGNVINVANLTAFQNATVVPGGNGRLTFDSGLAASGTVVFGGFVSGNSLNVGSSRALVIGGNNGNSQHTAGTLTAVGGLTKVGTGTLTLASVGSFAGGVKVNAGTLLVTVSTAAGSTAINLAGGTLQVNVSSGAGSIANAVVFNSTSSSYILERAVSSSFSAYTASSVLSGGINTTATLLSGTASATRTLATSFDTTSSAVNDGIRVSDVFTLDGTGTDIFVMQLAITDVTNQMYLGWLNGSDTWVNAVSGNSATGGSAIAGYSGSFAASGASASAAYLGSWGYDEVNNTVWAVLDHNSDFAVISVPEPTTVALLGLGLGALFWRGGSRRRGAGGNR